MAKQTVFDRLQTEVDEQRGWWGDPLAVTTAEALLELRQEQKKGFAGVRNTVFGVRQMLGARR